MNKCRLAAYVILLWISEYVQASEYFDVFNSFKSSNEEQLYEHWCVINILLIIQSKNNSNTK